MDWENIADPQGMPKISKEAEEFLRQDICCLIHSRAIRLRLEMRGVRKIKDLLKFSKTELLCFRGVGRGTVNKWEEKLRALDLEWGKDYETYILKKDTLSFQEIIERLRAWKIFFGSIPTMRIRFWENENLLIGESRSETETIVGRGELHFYIKDNQEKNAFFSIFINIKIKNSLPIVELKVEGSKTPMPRNIKKVIEKMPQEVFGWEKGYNEIIRTLKNLEDFTIPLPKISIY